MRGTKGNAFCDSHVGKGTCVFPLIAFLDVRCSLLVAV